MDHLLKCWASEVEKCRGTTRWVQRVNSSWKRDEGDESASSNNSAHRAEKDLSSASGLGLGVGGKG